MYVNANTQNKILSLLLDLSKCSFVRVTDFRRKGHVRYQYGDTAHCLLIQESFNEHDVNFVSEEVINFDGYQFRLSILSDHHIHIERSLVQESNATSNTRRAKSSITSNTEQVHIELVHHNALPHLIHSLGALLSNNVIGNESKNVAVYDEQDNRMDEQKWQAVLLIKTICTAVENLQLIDHYKQLTSDSLTKLHSRTALQAGIDEQIVHSSMVLCMIHCIDFQHVNRKFGQAKGDIVLHEIASVIEQHTRAEDISGRFGGALFGIAIHANSCADGAVLATKLQKALHNKTFLQNALRLTFNLGVAFVSQEEDQLDTGSTSSLLINRAEQALKAAQHSAKPTVVQWEADKFRLDEQDFNYLGGIFTPDNVTNYRNMLLLWDISSIIADEHTFGRLLKSVVERLAFTFEFAFAGLVSIQEQSLGQNYSFELKNATDIVDIEWASHPYRELIFNAAKLATQNAQHTEAQEDGLNSLVIPLGNDSNECFFIMGHNELLDLTHDTVMLFVGFARQLGKAFKRSQLEDQLNKNLEQQNAKLSQELLELKAGMQSSALVFRSAKMQKIVEQTQRAAQTDATVLITGESGTGKEKLINAIHVLSQRNKKPLVIVDCGSIPETLIESELFGFIKGAFTGAQSNSTGKIQAADGGILVLDEIGELPLSMQPKLLRFVQEKQYTPVGGNKAIAVDVKIIAVTNRDLVFEVANGKFRKDLFYRLNVVNLHNPPLRERTEDIDLLCQHFLSKFSRQFEMDKKRLNVNTIEKMKQYAWPGNIRELENKLMQATLLTTSDEIHFSDLNLESPSEQHKHSLHLHADEASTTQNSIEHKEAQTAVKLNHSIINQRLSNASTHDQYNDIISHAVTDTAQATDPTGVVSPKVSNELSAHQWCDEFSKNMARLLASLDMHTRINISVGHAVELVLLNMAHNQCGSLARTAVLLQLPISTARRRLHKPLPDVDMFVHNANWLALKSLLTQIACNQIQLHAPVDLIKRITAQNILNLHADNMGLASQLMGVSEPTMYKLRKQLQ